MKRKFYCDIPLEASDDSWLVATSSPTTSSKPNGSENSNRVEFIVDLPDEFFVKTVILKKIVDAVKV